MPSWYVLANDGGMALGVYGSALGDLALSRRAAIIDATACAVDCYLVPDPRPAVGELLGDRIGPDRLVRPTRYRVVPVHGEGTSVFHAVDTSQSADEQPAIIHSWSTRDHANAEFLAADFCRRHNAKEPAA